MQKLLFLCFSAALCWCLAVPSAVARPLAERPAYFELKVYHLKTARQEALIDSFLQHQYLPAMRAAGSAPIGVFKPIGNDTTADRRVYVFTPYASLKQWEQVKNTVAPKLLTAGGAYENAAYNNPAYTRLETIFIQAFEDMPALTAPQLDAPRSERVYELRSYEGASEKIFRNKVQMFNQGGEIKLFNRLGFHAVFFGSVVFGAHMPNLLYMTSFANRAAREAHWKAFGEDPEWKRLSALPEYQNNVAHIDIAFLRPTAYSDL